MICSVVLTQCQRFTDRQTDRRTDGRTDGRTDRIAIKIALCKAVLKRDERSGYITVWRCGIFYLLRDVLQASALDEMRRHLASGYYQRSTTTPAVSLPTHLHAALPGLPSSHVVVNAVQTTDQHHAQTSVRDDDDDM